MSNSSEPQQPPNQPRITIPVTITFTTYYLPRSQDGAPNGENPTPNQGEAQQLPEGFPFQLLSQILGGLSSSPIFVPMGEGGSMEDFLDRLYRMHQPQGPPPASQKVVDKLPTENVTEQQCKDGLECAICKDTFESGVSATKLPCEHRYHPDCIKTWLKDHCSCPVCRYELPVDDQEYEQDRKRRMADRHIHEDEITSDNEEPQAKNQKREDEAATEDVTVPTEEPVEHPSGHLCGMSKMHENEPCFLLEEEHYCTCACSHVFHEECLQSFLRVCGTLEPTKHLSDVGTFTCPQCRADTTILPTLEVD